MKLIMTLIAVVVANVFAVSASAQEASAQDETQTSLPDVTPELRHELRALQPLMGSWVIDGQWLDGRPLWSKTVYSVGLGGHFVEAKTWVRDRGEKPYQRYLTVWRWDSDNSKIIAHSFVYDGDYSEMQNALETDRDGRVSLTSSWTSPGSDTQFKQTVSLIDETSYSWKVWSIKDGRQTQLMDGVWKKQGN